MLDLYAELGQAAAAALRHVFADNPAALAAIPTELAVQLASRPEFGDLQIAGCLPLAKPLGKKPRDLAQLVADHLISHPTLGNGAVLAKVEIAGPGYVNLHLSDRYIESRITAAAS